MCFCEQLKALIGLALRLFFVKRYTLKSKKAKVKKQKCAAVKN